jgi:hypothetical protein
VPLYNSNQYPVSDTIRLFQGTLAEVVLAIKEYTDKGWKAVWTDMKTDSDGQVVTVLVAFV